MGNRIGTCTRKTKETDITLSINFRRTGQKPDCTGIPFFDHMLDGFARHGLFDLERKSKRRSESGPATTQLKIPVSY